jgi:hypothetical protein
MKLKSFKIKHTNTIGYALFAITESGIELYLGKHLSVTGAQIVAMSVVELLNRGEDNIPIRLYAD